MVRKEIPGLDNRLHCHELGKVKSHRSQTASIILFSRITTPQWENAIWERDNVE